MRDHANLVEAVDLATMNLEARVAARRQELIQENDAFISTRRVSFEDVHKRRLRVLERTLETNRERSRTRGIALTEAKIKKEKGRFATQLAGLESARTPSLTTDDLAACVVEVRA